MSNSTSPSTKASRSYSRPVVAVVLALLPLLVLLYKLPLYGLSFPYWDDLLLAPFLEKAYAGQLSLTELWTQHNEHRPFFPRLIMLGMALATWWDVGWVLAVSLLLGAGIFLLLAWLAWGSVNVRSCERANERTGERGGVRAGEGANGGTEVAISAGGVEGWAEGGGRPWGLLPVFSFFVFSWAQMENWVWGLEVIVFLCNFAVVAGVVLLAGGNGWGRFGLAVVAGVVATCSFANGMLYWLAAAPVLLVGAGSGEEMGSMGMTGRRRGWRAVVWAGVAVVVVGLYFVGYQKPGVSPSLLTVLKAPHEYLGYVLLYLGSPVVAIFSTAPWHGGPPHPIGPLHFVPGALGVGAAVGIAWGFWRASAFPVRSELGVPGVHRPWAQLAPWVSLAGFAVLSALATGIGRVGLGIYQGLNSRYMTTNMFFWCALAACGVILWRWWIAVRGGKDGREKKDSEDSRDSAETGVWSLESGGLELRTQNPELRTFLLWLCGCVLLIAATALTVHNNRPWEENARWKKLGWRALQAGYEAPLFLADLCWDPTALQQQYLPFLRAYELAGFTKTPPPPDPALAEPYVGEARLFLERGLLRPALTYAETALFFNPAHPSAAALREEILKAAEQRKSAQGDETKPESPTP